MSKFLLFGLLPLVTFTTLGQEANPTQQNINLNPEGQTPLYRVTVVGRTTKAINYHHRSGSTKVDLQGTALMPEAKGEVKVEAQKGATKLEVRTDKMRPAQSYGPEYLTYVLWAITPEGRPTNLGEVVLDKPSDDDAKLNTTSELQTFGLIVTAEPYFAVTQPSDVVVMENIVRNDTTGTMQWVDAKYELLQRGQYTMNVRPEDLNVLRRMDKTAPSPLLQARNAIQIARWTGAERYASDTLQKALVNLQNAEGYYSSKAGEKTLTTVARDATQMAEDARLITIRRIEEQRLADERAAADARERQAKAEAAEKARQAQLEVERRTAAEDERRAAQMEAERRRLEAERTRLEAERAQRDAEAARAAAEKAKAEAAVDLARLEKARQDAEAARAAALAQQQSAMAEAEKARLAAENAERQRLLADQQRQQAENEKAQMRAELQRQLNLVLQTRETARGLIVNVSDVLFDTGRHTLRAGANEKLAKVAGILLAHPGLKLEVEGHTDSVGSDDYNQGLSERRAQTVRDYLVRQGLASDAITWRGFGEAQPVASNDSASGRQQNRRVELVVSGSAIGYQATR